jgi:hypothetical protein
VSQSRRHSVTEAVTNVLVGFMVALAVQIAIYPVFGLAVTLLQNLEIAAIFTFVSLLRSYCLRRGFNWWASRPRRELDR